MRAILFLAHRLPYPPDRGDRIRSWHVLKALGQLAPVHVCALIDDECDRRHVAMVEQVAASVTVVHRTRSKLAAMASALVTGQPASVAAFMDDALMVAVRARLPLVDTVFAFSSQMAAYVPADFAGRFIMDFVDMDSAKFAALGGFANRQEAKRLRHWESATADRATLSLFVSQAEAELFTATTGRAASVLENGIDLAHFAPDVVAAVAACGPLILFTGQMDYPPNINAVICFVRNALPQIERQVPGVRFAIVGRAPTAAVQALAGDTVIVTGEVADTRPWLAAADVVVAPLAIARGIQNKVLEAMAMARPVVASSGAAQGIDAVDGRELIVADDPVDAVVGLLNDRSRADALARAARARVEARYGWDAQLAPLAGMLR